MVYIRNLRKRYGMFFIDRTLLNPNIPKSIRFTPVLYDWISEVREKEDLSFSQVVRICCKNAKDQYTDFFIDRTLLKPLIPRTIRFTSVLDNWISEVSEKEGISFNQTVLICCKYAKDQYIETKAQEEKE